MAIAFSVFVRDRFIHTSWSHFLYKKNVISGDIKHISRAYLMTHGSKHVYDI